MTEVTRAAAQAGDAAGRTGRGVAGQAGRAAGKAGETARGAAGQARDTGREAAGKAADTGQEAAGQARDAAQGVADKAKEAGQGIMASLPTGKLADAAQSLLHAAGERVISSAGDKIDGLTGRLTDYVEHGGKGLMNAVTGSDNPSFMSGAMSGAMKGGLKGGLMGGLKGGVKGLFQKITGKGGGKGGGKLKVTNIVESVDVGAPRRLVYNQWTMFQDFPNFMKKVEKVNQESDEDLSWRAQIFLSHRDWKAHIIEQIPDERIVWRSEGAKGYVDGAVTFHEITPDLTRVLVVLEYYPQGLFEHTGNMWRAQGRRVRLELKHFRRHAMVHLLLNPDEVGDGWRGEIRDSEVVKDHETAMREEQEQEQGPEEEGLAEGEEPEEGEEGERDEYEEEEEPEEEEEEEEEPEEGEPEEGEDGEEGEYEEEEEPEESEEPAAARRRQRAPWAEKRERPVRRRARTE